MPALAVLLLLPPSGAAAAKRRACPSPTADFRSDAGNEGKVNDATLYIQNGSPEPIVVVWLQPDGVEVDLRVVQPGDIRTYQTFSGHAFRFYTDRTPRTLLLEHVVTLTRESSNTDGPFNHVSVQPCGDAFAGAEVRDPECPVPTEGLQSGGYISNASFAVENLTPYDLDVIWMAPGGQEKVLGIVESYMIRREQSWYGHAFRYYARAEPRTLVFELVLRPNDPLSKLAVIKSCGILLEHERRNPKALDGGKGKLYESLVHDPQAPCEPEGVSSKWSCAKFITKEQYESRLKMHPKSFGFIDKAEAGHRQVGETRDTGYISHIPYMPRITDGPGFLIMSFPPELQKLVTWYHDTVNASMRQAAVDPGVYTNNHIHRFDEVSLDDFRDIHRVIKKEVKEVLQWWTRMPLKHTHTFGVRIYRREHILINHADKGDTHLASAVLQVHQEVDEDGGWPLEILDAQGNCHEVYLQPGEMVLYEGGKFQHGRPMRFRGKAFANVFSHFAPVDWYGLGKSPNFVSPYADRTETEEL